MRVSRAQLPGGLQEAYQTNHNVDRHDLYLPSVPADALTLYDVPPTNLGSRYSAVIRGQFAIKIMILLGHINFIIGCRRTGLASIE